MLQVYGALGFSLQSAIFSNNPLRLQLAELTCQSRPSAPNSRRPIPGSASPPHGRRTDWRVRELAWQGCALLAQRKGLHQEALLLHLHARHGASARLTRVRSQRNRRAFAEQRSCSTCTLGTAHQQGSRRLSFNRTAGHSPSSAPAPPARPASGWLRVSWLPLVQSAFHRHALAHLDQICFRAHVPGEGIMPCPGAR